MNSSRKRTIVDFDPVIHQVLQAKADETGRSISDLVNESVRMSYQEDAEDLQAYLERIDEPNLPFTGFSEN